MKTIWFNDYNQFMKQFRKYNLRRVHISMAPGLATEKVNGKSVTIPRMGVHCAARTKDDKYEFYLLQYFEDDEDAEFEYHQLRRRLDREELIIKYGMGGKW
jgi:hypothetical protein